MFEEEWAVHRLDSNRQATVYSLAMEHGPDLLPRRIVSLQPSATVKPKVYCEEWGKPMIHSQRWVAELVEAAGGEFVGTPGAHADPAKVVVVDPDVMIMAWCGAGDRVPLAKVVEQRGWSELRAVKQR